jgi:hypothetical protein
MIKYLYIFDEYGNGKSISSFEKESYVEDYINQLGIPYYYISDTNTIPIQHAKLENGILIERQEEESNEVKAQKAMTQRFFLLQASDWTDTVSAQSRLGPRYEEWQTYRQALRDITEQSGYPSNITWPTPPQG